MINSYYNNLISKSDSVQQDSVLYRIAGENFLVKWDANTDLNTDADERVMYLLMYFHTGASSLAKGIPKKEVRDLGLDVFLTALSSIFYLF